MNSKWFSAADEYCAKLEDNYKSKSGYDKSGLMDLLHDIIQVMEEKEFTDLKIFKQNDNTSVMTFVFDDMVLEYGRSDRVFDVLVEVDSFDFKQKNENEMLMTLYI